MESERWILGTMADLIERGERRSSGNGKSKQAAQVHAWVSSQRRERMGASAAQANSSSALSEMASVQARALP
ncbi:hypothetical protein C2845_PM03G06600 [Panicum miliaceum]|uniref:Uncharacterized protein n=1 Tax=Panicum miliaceum TaxID=4540 RepID=A0A3L6TEU2_PANMI|nr:hypothetical protein C2845_PM03G06600 [Panicum miliaceum]